MKNNERTKRFTSSKVVWIIASLLASFLIWTYVTTSEGTTVEVPYYGIQIVFQGESVMREAKSLIITGEETESINVKLSGNRRSLSRLSANGITAVVDLSSIMRPGLKSLPYTLMDSSGNEITSSDVTIVDSSTNVVTFSVDTLASKLVNVRGTFAGTLAEGFTAEVPVCEPATVTITGPQEALDTVSYALVEFSRPDVNKSFTVESTYVLMDAENNEITTESIEKVDETVSVTLPIMAVKDVELTLDIVPGGGATADNVIITCDPPYITLAGDTETLAGVNKISLGTLDLSDVEATFTKPYTIFIPNDTENLSGVTEATVTVEIVNLVSQKMTVSSLECANVPDGYTATVMSQSLEVTIRADKAALDSIQPNNLRAVADLSEIGTATGFMSVPVTVYVDGYPTAGAVGDVKMYISLLRDSG